jgi:hypothetical protein
MQHFLIRPTRASRPTSCMHVLPALWSPKVVTLNAYCPPSGVTKAVYFFARSVRGMTQYPLRWSSIEKMVASPRSFNTSWITSKGCAQSDVIPFKRQKSTQKRNFPFFLVAMTMGEEYHDDDASITPLANISFTCSWMVFFCAADY